MTAVQCSAVQCSAVLCVRCGRVFFFSKGAGRGGATVLDDDSTIAVVSLVAVGMVATVVDNLSAVVK